MLMTLLSMFGGGIMRLLPEVMALFGKKVDNSHELAMLEKQLEIENQKLVMALMYLEGEKLAGVKSAIYVLSEIDRIEKEREK